MSGLGAMKVEQAIQRLTTILPVKKRLDALELSSAQLYLAVVKGFFELGRAPFISELNAIDRNARQRIVELAQQDMLTLEESGEVKGCYPFTMEQRVHRIRLNGFEVHAMCAMDALAPSAMFGCESVVLSECAVTREAVRVELKDQTLLNPEQAAALYFGINWLAASSLASCSDSLCTEMLFLRDLATAQGWLEQDADNRQIFTLDEAVKFAAGFFKPLMQQG